MTERGDSLAFLQAIYADALAKSAGYLLVWTASPKRSAWFRSIEDAASYAGRCASDTYVGVGLGAQDYGEHARAKAAQIIHVPALWIDLDYLDDVHQHDDLPQDEEEAHQLIEDVGIEPTVVVHTGHGLQAWWRIDGGECETDELRAVLATTIRGWQQTRIAKARAQRNWRIDATHDLARLMRLPGTWNCKAEMVPVRIIEGPNPIIVPIGLFVNQIEDQPAATAAPSNGPIILRPDAEPPSEKFSILLKVEKRFKGAWERSRTDVGDRSASGWDMALADVAVEAGWLDQEIVNLLIASRRKHGDDLKLRQDYYANTLAKAHVLNGNIEQRLATLACPTIEAKNAVRLAYVSEHLGLSVHSMIRHPGPPASYRLLTELGAIPIKTIEGLTSATKFRNLVADGTRHVVPTMKPKRWDTVVQTLLDICEDDVIEDSTEEGKAKDWLDGYLLDGGKIFNSADAAAHKRLPFFDITHEGRVAFFGDGIHTWLVQKRMERVTKSEMSALLRTVGCEQARINIELNGKRTTRLIWLRPHPNGAESYSD